MIFNLFNVYKITILYNFYIYNVYKIFNIYIYNTFSIYKIFNIYISSFKLQPRTKQGWKMKKSLVLTLH